MGKQLNENKFQYRLFLIFFFIFFIVSSYTTFFPERAWCSDMKMTGFVKHFLSKNGIEETSINVFHPGINKKYTALSDKNGKYSVSVFPGEFYVTVSKPGYTTIKKKLNVVVNLNFSTDTIYLIPIPETEGLFIVDGEKVKSLNKDSVEAKMYNSKSAGMFTLTNLGLYVKKQALNVCLVRGKEKATEIGFIDTIPKSGHNNLKLFKINNDGLFVKIELNGNPNKGGIINKTAPKEIKTERLYYGQEHLLLIDAKLGVGSYCFTDRELDYARSFPAISEINNQWKVYSFTVK